VPLIKKEYDVVVIGTGHAGLEAAFAAAKRNLKVALVTLHEQTIALMPCNPSIGGPAKGIVTREIDALGGIQAIAADANQLQMKLLNTSKGPGVWALRAQIDKVTYQSWFINELKKWNNIDLILDEVLYLYKNDDNLINKIELRKNGLIDVKYVIMTTGTYLKAKTFQGSVVKIEGPDKYEAVINLSDCLKDLGFDLIRLKTGTPPRIEMDSIDYSKLTIEPGTDAKLCFSHFNQIFLDFDKQFVCYGLYTQKETHAIINANLEKSAMYGGIIKDSIGPRYCPSIEDKIVKFSNKERHQLFLEYESRSLTTMYLGGFSTSMPIDIQKIMVHSLPGLEECIISKYAYAIEYDAIDPLQLFKTLNSKKYHNLYFAGQINGTSGYEEAAAQGLIAGINVANHFQNKKPLILKRDEAYIGVMIDDITTRGVTEPYRLLTSRAEYRLNLRNDNVCERLLKIGFDNEMISSENYEKFLKQQKIKNEIIEILKLKTIGMLDCLKYINKKTNLSLYDYMKRNTSKLSDILKYIYPNEISFELQTKIEIEIKFDGYIKRQNEEIRKNRNLDYIKLDHLNDYSKISNLSLEAVDKLNKILPNDLDQASRISGINVPDILAIKYYIEKQN